MATERGYSSTGTATVLPVLQLKLRLAPAPRIQREHAEKGRVRDARYARAQVNFTTVRPDSGGMLF